MENSLRNATPKPSHCSTAQSGNPMFRLESSHLCLKYYPLEYCRKAKQAPCDVEHTNSCNDEVHHLWQSSACWSGPVP